MPNKQQNAVSMSVCEYVCVCICVCVAAAVYVWAGVSLSQQLKMAPEVLLPCVLYAICQPFCTLQWKCFLIKNKKENFSEGCWE